MKSTDQFKEIILNHLTQTAESNELFAKSFNKPEKNIDDCITYILNTVQKSGCNGFSDEEIFGMAMHYFDEDNIEIGKSVTSVKIVTNQKSNINQESKSTKEEVARSKPEKKRDPDNYPHQQLSMF